MASTLRNGITFRRRYWGGYDVVIWDTPLGTVERGTGRLPWLAQPIDALSTITHYATRTEAANALAERAGYRAV